jgi:hypothetical protein
MADNLGGIRPASCSRVLNIPCQRVDNIAREVSTRRRKRSALLASEVILQDRFAVVLGNNQVVADRLKSALKDRFESETASDRGCGEQTMLACPWACAPKPSPGSLASTDSLASILLGLFKAPRLISRV